MTKLRITREQFMLRMADMNHNYDFSQFEYKGNAVKSTAICHKHGPFEISPNALSNGQGCRKCGIERRAASKTVGFHEFVIQARVVHGDAFSYSESAWHGLTKPTLIHCKEHDTTFTQLPTSHLKGSGCQKCRSEKLSIAHRSSQDEFIAKSINAHGDTYDLSLVRYVNSTTKVDVVCRKHGVFSVRAGNFINRKSGCPLCAAERTSVRSRSDESETIAKLTAIHNGRYTYIGVTYEDGRAFVRAVCQEHGDFTQLVSDHMSGHGCQRCNFDVWDTESFIRKAREVHGDKYSYAKTQYINAFTRVTITCPTHGDFEQGATYHVNNGNGCPACGKVLVSKGQAEIADMLRQHTTVIDNHRLPSGRHVDISMPDHMLGVEYHGLIWHSERFAKSHMRDYAKHKEAAANGIRLIHVYSDEWLYRGHVVTAMLRRAVGVKSDRVFARECRIEILSDAEVSKFYEDTHIQGAINSACFNVGLSFRGETVAAMSFSRVTSVRGEAANPKRRELRRFATSTDVIGGASRLLRHFLRCFPEVTEVISYSDNRMFSGQMYQKLGFTIDSVSEPSYSYVNSSVRWREEKHKFTRARMSKRHGFTFNPALSEKENCEANKWYRVYDCGKTKWVLKVE